MYVLTTDDDEVSANVWDCQCCGVNLFLKVAKMVETNYGYTMAPDNCFVKILSFAIVFRVVACLALVVKRRQLKRGRRS